MSQHTLPPNPRLLLAWIAAMAVVPGLAHAERIFPSLPDEYRSGTVELRLANNRADDGGGYGGYGGSGYGGGGPDGFGNSSMAVTKTRSEQQGDAIFGAGDPTGLRMGAMRGGGGGSSGCGCSPDRSDGQGAAAGF